MAIISKIFRGIWRVFKVMCFTVGCLLLLAFGWGICNMCRELKWHENLEALAPASEVEVLDSYVDEFSRQYIIRIRSEAARAYMIEQIFRRNEQALSTPYGFINPDETLRRRFAKQYGEGKTYVFSLYGECPYERCHHGYQGMLVIEGKDDVFFVSYDYY